MLASDRCAARPTCFASRCLVRRSGGSADPGTPCACAAHRDLAPFGIGATPSPHLRGRPSRSHRWCSRFHPDLLAFASRREEGSSELTSMPAHDTSENYIGVILGPPGCYPLRIGTPCSRIVSDSPLWRRRPPSTTPAVGATQDAKSVLTVCGQTRRTLSVSHSSSHDWSAGARSAASTGTTFLSACCSARRLCTGDLTEAKPQLLFLVLPARCS